MDVYEREKVYFLREIADNSVDAVIFAETSTKEEIQEAINKVKSEIDCFTWEDLLEALPEDCKIYDRWENNEEIYY